VIVTHDVAEVLVISDVVALLDGGVMRFAGTPEAFAGSTDAMVRDFRESAAALNLSISNLRQSGASSPSSS
jgi:ABC-type transporter Mla maintaining outer membrane lipid asymmetry ATPase subunit MlaF